MTFIRILLQHLLTQKWFKSFCLATVLTIAVWAKDELWYFVKNYKILSWVVIFLIFYIRLLVQELFVGKKYFSKAVVNESDFHHNFVKHITYGEEQRDGYFVVYFMYEWKFKENLLIVPALELVKLEVNDPSIFIGCEISKIHTVTEKVASFQIDFKFKHPINEDAQSFKKIVKEIEIEANAKYYSPETYKGKILDFVTVALPKKLGIFC